MLTFFFWLVRPGLQGFEGAHGWRSEIGKKVGFCRDGLGCSESATDKAVACR